MNGLNVNWPSIYDLQISKFTTKQIHVYDLNGFIELRIQDNQEPSRAERLKMWAVSDSAIGRKGVTCNLDSI